MAASDDERKSQEDDFNFFQEMTCEPVEGPLPRDILINLVRVFAGQGGTHQPCLVVARPGAPPPGSPISP